MYHGMRWSCSWTFIKKFKALLYVSAFYLATVFAGVDSESITDVPYHHDYWKTGPADIVRNFEAYVVSFDGKDDDDGDGRPDCWAIPEWVAYEVREHLSLGPGPKRPAWFTDPALFKGKIAPNDRSYAYSAAKKKKMDISYDRGHMCPKYTAYRLGPEADKNTHTFLNACPQVNSFNQHIWEDLEREVDHWADSYGQVWIICGPIIKNKKPSKWIGEKGEVPVAVPDALFKIVIKNNSAAEHPEVLAFIYENKNYPTKEPFHHERFLVGIDEIEEKTGLDFLQRLPAEEQKRIESKAATELWR